MAGLLSFGALSAPAHGAKLPPNFLQQAQPCFLWRPTLRGYLLERMTRKSGENDPLRPFSRRWTPIACAMDIKPGKMDKNWLRRYTPPVQFTHPHFE